MYLPSFLLLSLCLAFSSLQPLATYARPRKDFGLIRAKPTFRVMFFTVALFHCRFDSKKARDGLDRIFREVATVIERKKWTKTRQNCAWENAKTYTISRYIFSDELIADPSFCSQLTSKAFVAHRHRDFKASGAIYRASLARLHDGLSADPWPETWGVRVVGIRAAMPVGSRSVKWCVPAWWPDSRTTA